MAQPNWTVSPTQYQNSMNILGVLNIEGSISKDIFDKIGVFSGNECRGAANISQHDGKYYVLLTVWSNVSQDEYLSVRIYDNSTQKTYVLKQQIKFIKDEIIGSYENPYVFYTNLKEKKLEAYNFFTPNGDGKNDFFVVDDLLAVEDMTLKIYSAKGIELFSQPNYDNTWNGTDKNGNDLPKGNYYYIFTDKDGAAIYKGSITLIR
jgi:gliding motility-associated-like protein